MERRDSPGKERDEGKWVLDRGGNAVLMRK